MSRKEARSNQKGGKNSGNGPSKLSKWAPKAPNPKAPNPKPRALVTWRETAAARQITRSQRQQKYTHTHTHTLTHTHTQTDTQRDFKRFTPPPPPPEKRLIRETWPKPRRQFDIWNENFVEATQRYVSTAIGAPSANATTFEMRSLLTIQPLLSLDCYVKQSWLWWMLDAVQTRGLACRPSAIPWLIAACS